MAIRSLRSSKFASIRVRRYDRSPTAALARIARGWAGQLPHLGQRRAVQVVEIPGEVELVDQPRARTARPSSQGKVSA
jgi:hypothetical protein